GATSFAVDGLVINGTIFSGTPGPVTAVTGTLVCNPGDPEEAALDTRAVTLNSRGDAAFVGHLQNLPETCANPLFLIRIATPAGAAGRWIATGADRFIGGPRAELPVRPPPGGGPAGPPPRRPGHRRG